MFQIDIWKKYKKINIIGNGIYGNIYKVKNKINGYYYAIQEIDKQKINQTIDILKREIEIMNKIKKENIVNIKEVIDSNKFIYVVMDLCECNLEEKLKEVKEMKVERKPSITITTKQIVKEVKNPIISRIIMRQRWNQWKQNVEKEIKEELEIENQEEYEIIGEEINEELNKLIEKLKKEMEEVRKKSDKDLVDLAIKNKLKFSILKKKMMENIKNSQIKVTELNMQYMDVSSKLTLLQNHQLLTQLEYLQEQLAEYTKTNEALKKNNIDLKRDIEIHKEVELSLAEKNRKLKNELLKEKEEKDDNEDNRDKENEDNKEENLIGFLIKIML